MSSGMKDLEIVYNLQWKNVPSHGDDKANIVGMYDIPATTLNWEAFKSYLLKNSGVTGDDVKVSYISIDEKEFPIDSQLDFQIALYLFRQRARKGEIITLKLDRISDHTRTCRIKRLRRSAEPHMEEEKAQVASEAMTVQNEAPPDWFKQYMKGFKKEIVEEVTSSVVNYVSTIKPASSAQFPCHHTRKSKIECCKRPRKAPLVVNRPENNEKELMKSIKLERKLDCKLEKLEQKTMKIKEKKMALVRPGDDDTDRSNSHKNSYYYREDTEVYMDASAVGHHESTIAHMYGGETYQQEWEVLNTGEMPWTVNTELRYAWGSEALKSVEKIVPCPELKPGEKGTVVVYLEIPRKPGNYECYWHFYHEGRRFGHWLGCQVIVDPSPVKLTPPLKDHILPATDTWSSKIKKLKTDDLTLDSPRPTHEETKVCLMEQEKPLNTAIGLEPNKEIQAVSAELCELTLFDDPIVIGDSSSSDSDNQSIVSIADSSSSMNSAPSDEFVVIPVSECFVNPQSIPEQAAVDQQLSVKLEKVDPTLNSFGGCDVTNRAEELPVASTETKGNDNETFCFAACDLSSPIQSQDKASSFGYAYVTVDGEKIAVPKRFLRDEYLEKAEDAPNPNFAIIPKEEVAGSFVNTVSENLLLKEKVPVENSTADEQSVDETSACDHKPLNWPTEIMYVPLESVIGDSPTSDCPDKSRLFVFPLNCPGFEVVYPPVDENVGGPSPPQLNDDGFYVGLSTPMNRTSTPRQLERDYLGYPNSTWNCANNVPGENPFSHVMKKSASVSSLYRGGGRFDSGLPPQDAAAFLPERILLDKARNRLHHRFSGYMRHRLPFNHGKHCSGGHCRQPFFTNSPAPSTTFPGSNESTGDHYFQTNCVNSEGCERIRLATPRCAAGPQAHAPSAPKQEQNVPSGPTGMHLLPDTLVSGAVNVASSAINTARSVLNMFSPPPRHEEQGGQWGASEMENTRERAMRALQEMGFWEHDLNASLLELYNDDLTRVISELLQ